MSRPRDTPVDTPAAIVEASVTDPTATSVALARSVETLEAGYTAWVELRTRRELTLQQLEQERRRIDAQGTLLINAARLVVAPSPFPGLVIDPFADARRQLDDARLELERQRLEAISRFDAAQAQVRDLLVDRVKRFAETRPPIARLMVRVLPGDRRILHLQRPTGDEPVLLLYALARRIPSRFDFLFDDSTDDPTADPPTLYAEEGVSQTRCEPAHFASTLERLPVVWPVKSVLPHLEGASLFRWKSRGPVLEAEVADGAGFRNLLTTTEAELATAALLRLKLAGAIGFEFVRG